jgi:16S rRNA processing protein RimM
LGVDNTTILGCPSVLINPDPRLGEKLESRIAALPGTNGPFAIHAACIKPGLQSVERELTRVVMLHPGSAYFVQRPLEMIKPIFGDALTEPGEIAYYARCAEYLGFAGPAALTGFLRLHGQMPSSINDWAHGLRGDVFVQLLSDSDARVAAGSEMFADGELLVVERSRMAGSGRRVVKFAQIADRTAADKYVNRALRGRPIDDPDALWVHDMIGRRVVETDGSAHGVCVSVLANPAADLLELDSGALVPSNFVVSIDDHTITVDTPEGLFDLLES